MNKETLVTYLNDHLSGSVAALELIDHLIKDATEISDAQFFRELKEEIEADQDTLRELIAHFGADENSVRKVAASLLEKVGWAKMSYDGPAGSSMRQLQALEGLLLGITGKRALWQALAAMGLTGAGLDLPVLIQRAETQRDKVEARRIDAARGAFGA